jgi:glycosyltransferase involved in cell wall biosynthesis
MRLFANQIAAGLRGRGHMVEELTAPVFFGRFLPRSALAAKWLGYVDQFLIFPPWLWLRARLLPPDALCVLSDQALGPWLPWIGRRAHVVHCHDLLALEAAMGRQPFHRLGWSGRLYQRWILRGFRRGRFFLSVSAATQADLRSYFSEQGQFCAVLYNPLASRFALLPRPQASAALLAPLPQLDQQPFLIHIGKNWYKNRMGALCIWEQLLFAGTSLHIVLVGSLDRECQAWLLHRPHLSHLLHVLDRADDDLIVALYNRASALLFPSHAEGFGWPILEALACGCPVITTNRPPMTEVGGDAVTTLPPAPPPPQLLDAWAWEAAQKVQKVLSRSDAEQERVRQLGFAQVRLFRLKPWLDQLEAHYQQALVLQLNPRSGKCPAPGGPPSVSSWP